MKRRQREREREASGSFPGPQKEMVEKFIFRLFEERRGGTATKEDILVRAEPFALAPDVLVFFEALPERPLREDELIAELNSIIERFGRTNEFGGLLEKIDHTPEGRKEAYRPLYESRKHS